MKPCPRTDQPPRPPHRWPATGPLPRLAACHATGEGAAGSGRVGRGRRVRRPGGARGIPLPLRTPGPPPAARLRGRAKPSRSRSTFAEVLRVIAVQQRLAFVDLGTDPRRIRVKADGLQFETRPL